MRNELRQAREQQRAAIRWIVAAAAAFALLATACTTANDTSSAGSNTARPESLKVINSDASVGPNRLAFSLKDSAGQFVGSPDSKLQLSLFESGSTEPIAKTDATFVWIHEGSRGLYTANFDIPKAGEYEVEATTTGTDSTKLRATFNAQDTSSTPAIGAPAPASKTKTAADTAGNLRAITTDENPDPALYALSIADAIKNGKPTVIAFSTPARCASNMCGPALDVVKEASKVYPNANYVHVEIYDKPQDVGDDTLVAAINEWGLPTEPWVFVVDASGKVAAKFESVVSVAEITSALQAK